MLTLSSKQFHHLHAILADLEDVSDAAFQPLCEERIAADPMFKGMNPFDVWCAWVEGSYSDDD